MNDRTADATSVLVVAADPLARGGIAALLGSTPAVTVVGSVAPEEASAMAASVEPDSVLVDLGHEEHVDTFLSALGIDAPILALAADQVQAAEAQAAHAAGVLSRDATPEALIAALASVAVGLRVSDPRFVIAQPIPRVIERGGTLTPREHEVLGLIAGGLPNKTIARELGLSEHTVKFHVTALMSKLEAQSRAEAVAEGFRRGLIAL